MSIFEYNEEQHTKTIREENIEEGIERGREEGRKEGYKELCYQLTCEMLRDNQPPELISKYTKQPVEYVYQIQEELLSG